MSAFTPYVIPNTGIANSVLDATTKRYYIQPEQVDITQYKSYLGTPVFSPLLLLDTSNSNFTNPHINTDIGEQLVDAQPTQGAQNILLRIDSCIVTIRQRKEIILTKIQGRAGTIKEYISLGDYEIQVEGVISSEYLGVYPEEDVNLLKDWLTRPNKDHPLPSVQMTSEFLNRFAILDVVVTDFDIPQLVGSRNTQPFKFTALSDVAFDDIIQYSQNINASS